jgi:hypothetical protein
MPNSDERRHFHRILFDANAELSFDLTSCEVQVLDISLQGALVTCKLAGSHIPEKGQELTLDIRLDGDVHIVMHGEASHIEDGRLGVACTSIDIDSITHLRRLLELNLGDPELLDRELAALYHD